MIDILTVGMLLVVLVIKYGPKITIDQVLRTINALLVLLSVLFVSDLLLRYTDKFQLQPAVAITLAFLIALVAAIVIITSAVRIFRGPRRWLF